MHFTITLPEREQQLTMVRQRWVEVREDRQWEAYEGRIETNGYGYVLMSPPPGLRHSSRQGQILLLLSKLLDGRVLPECPILTVDGVRGMDIGWYSNDRFGEARIHNPPELAPEICVEVLSPSNTEFEMETKRRLYFDAGAQECWQCDTEGNMTYYHQQTPNQPDSASTLCPNFPNQIEE